MTVPGKLYYNITELSGGRWPTTTKGDILEWCLGDHFPLYVYWDGMLAVKGGYTVAEKNEAARKTVEFKKIKGEPVEDHLHEQTENGKYEMPPEVFIDGLYAELPTEVIARMAYGNEDPVQDTMFFVPGKDGEFYSVAATKDGIEDIPYTVYKKELLVSGSDVEKMEEKYKTLTDGSGDRSMVVKERKHEAVLLQTRLAIFSGRVEATAEGLENTATAPVMDIPGVETEEAKGNAVSLRKNGRKPPSKLRAAVDAWDAVSSEPLPLSKTPSQAIKAWLRGNFERYEDLVLPEGTLGKKGHDLGGQPNTDAINQIAKILNWEPRRRGKKTP